MGLRGSCNRATLLTRLARSPAPIDCGGRQSQQQQQQHNISIGGMIMACGLIKQVHDDIRKATRADNKATETYCSVLCCAMLCCSVCLMLMQAALPAATHVHGTQTHSQKSGWACGTHTVDRARVMN